jgi:hypothetical protein
MAVEACSSQSEKRKESPPSTLEARRRIEGDPLETNGREDFIVFFTLSYCEAIVRFRAASSTHLNNKPCLRH